MKSYLRLELLKLKLRPLLFSYRVAKSTKIHILKCLMLLYTRNMCLSIHFRAYIFLLFISFHIPKFLCKNIFLFFWISSFRIFWTYLLYILNFGNLLKIFVLTPHFSIFSYGSVYHLSTHLPIISHLPLINLFSSVSVLLWTVWLS